MSTRTIILAKLCTNAVLAPAVVMIAAMASVAQADWSVDFSRREQVGREKDLREPASSDQPILAEPPKAGFFETIFQSNEIAEEIVVLNTDKGFVPSTVRVKKGLAYQIHVVNVNEKEKNVSFVLDSFSEHHATFYGKVKTFVIRPQKEGVFRFVSPETSAQGKLVVYPANGPESRLPASAASEKVQD